MSLEFAAALSHAPGITGRRATAPEEEVAPLFEKMSELRERLAAARLDALVVITAEHFANFFMDNMPAYCIGLGEAFEGPVEDESFLRIPKCTVPGAPHVARAIATALLEETEISYSEELKLDHGVMVPLHFITPQMDLAVIPIIINCLKAPLPGIRRCYEFGRILRRAIDERHERIGLIATGGLSHWPAMPGSGRVNEAWDREFLSAFLQNDAGRLAGYSNESIVEHGGPGGHEVRAWIALAGATAGKTGELLLYKPMPSFAIGGAVAVMVAGQ